MTDDFYVTIPMKLRITDLSRINDAADAEIAKLRAQYPDREDLMEYARPSAFIGLKWFLGGTRLQYLFKGVEMIVEMPDITSSEIFPLERIGEHLHDWWIDELPEYVTGVNEFHWDNRMDDFRAGLVVDGKNFDTYSIGILENLDGSGQSRQSLLFSRDKGDPDPGDSYCVVTAAGTHYGGLRECQIMEDRLRLVFTNEASEVLRAEKVINVELSDLEASQIALLKKGLRRILIWGDHDKLPIMNF